MEYMRMGVDAVMPPAQRLALGIVRTSHHGSILPPSPVLIAAALPWATVGKGHRDLTYQRRRR